MTNRKMTKASYQAEVSGENIKMKFFTWY